MRKEDVLGTLLGLVTIFLSLARGCQFPSEWLGQWYQDDFTVTIEDTAIRSPSVRGRCHKRDDKLKFLLHQKDKNCYVCVAFFRRHANLIQFKKSDCINTPSFSLCTRISGDSVLYTLLKLPSRPVRCPFEGPYQLTYQSNGHQCPKTSYIDACADHSKFRIHYKHCNPPDEVQEETYNFTCLATWEFNHPYLYARREGSNFNSRKDMYRCFVHTKFAQMGYMSRSVDPSCRLEGGPREGNTALTLNKDVSQWPKTSCIYPEYMTAHQTWRDLSGRHLLEIHPDDKFATVRFQKTVTDNVVVGDGQSYPESLAAFRCLKKFKTRGQTYYRTFATTDKCTSHHQCVRIEHKSSGVLEFYMGAKLKNSQEMCTAEHFLGSTKYVFIPSNSQPVPCPHPGTYHTTHKSCRNTVKIGCGSRDELVIESECSGKDDTTAHTLRCRQTFGGSTHYRKHVVVDIPGDSSTAYVCLIFEKRHGKLSIFTSSECGHKVRHPVLGNSIQLKLNSPPERCKVAPTKITTGYQSSFNRPGADDKKETPPNTSQSVKISYSLVCILVLLVLAR